MLGLIPDLRWRLIGGIRENTSRALASTTVIVRLVHGPGVRGTTVKIQEVDATVGIPESVHRLNQQKQKNLILEENGEIPIILKMWLSGSLTILNRFIMLHFHYGQRYNLSLNKSFDKEYF